MRLLQLFMKISIFQKVRKQQDTCNLNFKYFSQTKNNLLSHQSSGDTNNITVEVACSTFVSREEARKGLCVKRDMTVNVMKRNIASYALP